MMRQTCCSVLILVTSLTGLAYADAGYYSGVKGARAAGRAGAFTAKADDLTAAALNPAGLARIRSTTLHVGNRFSYNALSYRRAPTLDWGAEENGAPPYVEFDEVENDVPWQLLDPMLGVATTFGLTDWTFALTVYSPASAGREEYPLDGGQRYMMVSRDVIMLNVAASAAWRLSDVVGIGASLVWINVPRLKYDLVVNGAPMAGSAYPVTSPMDVVGRTSGADYFTLNGILGAWFRPAPFLEIGLSGQVIPTSIETSSELEVQPVSDSLTGGDPIQPTRNGVAANDVTITLPLPLVARGGVRYRHLDGGKELFDVELDLTYETWSRVDKFAVRTNGLQAQVRSVTVDIGTIEVQKQWQDTYTVSLGSDYVAAPDALTLRGGLFYSSAATKAAYANVDFAAGEHVGGALGASIFAGPVELAVAYEYRQQLPLEVSEGDARLHQEVPGNPCQAPYTDPASCHPQFLGQASPAVNAGRYDAHSHVLSLDGLYRF